MSDAGIPKTQEEAPVVEAPVAPAVEVPAVEKIDASAEATGATAAPTTTEATASPSSAAAQLSPSTSLYVGELDLTVTEAMLYDIFSRIGPVASIRVCRDAVTRRSLGYAYVNYLNANDGERALEALNYSLIKNRACRIMWSQRDPALRKTGAGNIFIKNLDENIDNKALHDTFAAFGNILSCKVAYGPAGESLGYGFVHYDSGEAAQAAIQNVDGMLLNDKIVYVGIHVPKRERQAKIDEGKAQFTNLYVKNVPLDVTKPELEELFAKYGKVLSAAITVDAEGKSKGFGFVNMDTHESAAKALEELHEKDFRGQNLFVTRAQRKGEREEELKKSYEQKKYETTLKYQGVNLYVKNLDDDVTDEKLRAEFEPFGQITSCTVMKDDRGVSKGFGFVCFSAPDEATKAVTELHGKIIGSKPLYVSLAQRKDVRKQQLEAQVQQRNQIRTQQLQASGLPPIPFGGQPPMYAYPGGFQGGVPPRPMGFPQQQPGGLNNRPRFYQPQPGQQMPMPGMPGMGMQPGMPMGYQQQYPGQAYGMPPRGVPAGIPRGPAGPGQAMPQRPMQPPMLPRAGAPIPNGAARIPQAPRAPGYKLNAGVKEPATGPGLTAAQLVNAEPQEQKQMLGEALYPKISETQPELSGKITGMLLEMDSSELLYLLENDEALQAKIKEAMEVLEEFAAKTGATVEA